MTRLLAAHDGSTAADAAITAAGALHRLVIAVYLLLGVLIGMFGSLSQRRAEASERKHAALGGVGRPPPVAALVARAAAPATVFAAVATEVGRLLGIRDVTMFRYEDDGTATVVAAGSTGQGSFPVGARLPLEGVNVASPIVVDGRRWGR